MNTKQDRNETVAALDPDVDKKSQHVDSAKHAARHDAGHTDIGLEYFLQSQTMEAAHRDQIARTVLKKIDYVLLPFVRDLAKLPMLKFAHVMPHRCV
jgi:hypothetical protein